MKSYRCLLLDFDGTLADSYDAITASVNHVLAVRGKPPLPEAEVRTKVGFGLDQLMATVLPDSDPHENARIYRAHHPSVMFSGTRLLPGTLELLQTLKERDVAAGICSNKPSAITKQLAVALGIEPYVQAVLGPEDVVHPKPMPDMVFEGMRRLNSTPAETLFIGDMTIDLQTARAAGVAVWLVATGSHSFATLADAGPDLLLHDLDGVRHHLFPVLIA